MKKIWFLLILLTAGLIDVKGQSFQIMRYGIEDGLSHESTFTISQDQKGFVWIGTAQGICRFDGKNFVSIFQGDPMPESVVSASFVDSHGRNWFGHMDGTISFYRKNELKVITPDDNHGSLVVGFAEDESGKIYAMTQQSGLAVIDREKVVHYITSPFSGTFVSSFLRTADGSLLVGTFNGISLFTPVSDTSGYVKSGMIQGLPSARIRVIKPGSSPGTYWIGTGDEGLYFMKGSGNRVENYTVRNVGEKLGLHYSNIAAIEISRYGYFWISDYGQAVYRFKTGQDGELTNGLKLTEASGLPEKYINDIMEDDEGNIWFASQGNGIAVLRDQAFSFYDLAEGQKVPEISAIEMKGNDYWFGASGELIWTDGTNSDNRKVYRPADGLPDDKITALFLDEEHNLYIGTDHSGVYLLSKKTGIIKPFFKVRNSLGNSVNALKGTDEFIWIATNDGVYRIDKITGESGHLSTLTGLPHNIINDLLVDHNGKVWIATRVGGLICINDNLSYMIQGNPKLEFVSLVEDNKGEIWAGTKEDGVIKFNRDTIAVYNENNGLKSRYTYAVGIDPAGYIWVGHRLGLSRIDPKTNNISIYGPEMGFTSDILHNAIDENINGLVLFGTNDGLIVYDTYQARPDTVPPRLNFTQVTISDSIYDFSNDIKLPYGIYKLRIDYIGINLSSPEQVLYKYKLDGFDDWSDLTRETTARYTRIEDGNYTFMLMACDGNGNCTDQPLTLHISVKIPIWKAWWFITLLIVIAIATVFTIIKVRERNQKALQEYLEDQLEQRTREVMNQKEEIEIKNRDITDSINYAQRIQASILPPVQRLNNTFSGSFVFYQPRDIVSGDFYWYDRIDDERFMIVCADSTGHGVPGAFMSMIGTTLIKDICLREDVRTPAEVLETLDNEVREALHQNQETDGSNDGMDIIVAEINMKTLHFQVSSAMRPVILYTGGEQVYVKGSRSSVGGQMEESYYEKEFINEEFQLSKGDIIYMFSDGYPDQFGGPLGRKFKMVRLKNLLRDIHDKPMEEQFNYIKSNFFLWKEDLEQVDDVLFMGIKI